MSQAEREAFAKQLEESGLNLELLRTGLVLQIQQMTAEANPALPNAEHMRHRLDSDCCATETSPTFLLYLAEVIPRLKESSRSRDAATAAYSKETLALLQECGCPLEMDLSAFEKSELAKLEDRE